MVWNIYRAELPSRMTMKIEDMFMYITSVLETIFQETEHFFSRPVSAKKSEA